MTLALLLTLLLHSLDRVTDEVDVIERNVVCDWEGRESLTQYIFWRMQTVSNDSDYHVVDWRLAKDIDAVPNKVKNRFRLDWYDKKTKRHRRVVCRVYRERATLYDPEVHDRDFVSCDKRRGFTSAK